MKKRMIFSAAFLVFAVALVVYLATMNTGSDTTNNNIQAQKTESVTEVTEKEIDRTDWRLILVNFENAIPSDYKFNLAKTYNSAQVDERIKEPLEKMIDDAKKAGYELYIRSSYRSREFQTRIFNNKIKMYMNQGNSREEAERLTLEYSSRPGHSEHEIGLCVDLVSSNYRNLDDEQDNQPEQKWLHENCWKYGFILRYPQNKTEITHVNYESWHYRYVGYEAAEYITKNGLTLEEYLA